MPILGTVASSYKSAVATSFESIATFTGTSTSSIEFTNIPGTYTHLQIRFITKDNRSGTSLNNLNLTVNSDTGSNYTDQYNIGDGSGSVYCAGSTSQTVASLGLSPSGTSTANVFGVGIIDILDYANTNKYKTIRSLHGVDSNGSGSVRQRGSLWMNTNAITTLKLFPASSGSFDSNSHFALYGIKGVA